MGDVPQLIISKLTADMLDDFEPELKDNLAKLTGSDTMLLSTLDTQKYGHMIPKILEILGLEIEVEADYLMPYPEKYNRFIASEKRKIFADIDGLFKKEGNPWFYFGIKEHTDIYNEKDSFTNRTPNIDHLVFIDTYDPNKVERQINAMAGFPRLLLTGFDEGTLRSFYKFMIYHELGHSHHNFHARRADRETKDVHTQSMRLENETFADIFSLKHTFHDESDLSFSIEVIELVRHLRALSSLLLECNSKPFGVPFNTHATGNLYRETYDDKGLGVNLPMDAKDALLSAQNLNALVFSAYISVEEQNKETKAALNAVLKDLLFKKCKEDMAKQGHQFSNDEIKKAVEKSFSGVVNRFNRFDRFELLFSAANIHFHETRHIILYQTLKALLDKNILPAGSDEFTIANNYIEAMDALLPWVKDHPKVLDFCMRASKMDYLFINSEIKPDEFFAIKDTKDPDSSALLHAAPEQALY